MLAGKFRVERLLGAGGMGSVVEATDTALGRKVAVKIAHPQLLEESSAATRFVREARAMAQLRGAGFVRVFEVGMLDGKVPFLAMELLHGHDLKARLRERGPFPLEALALLFAEACEALAEAHAHGLVHRDIKPSNLFAERRPGGREMLRVLDFGISKPGGVDAGTLTASSATLGSPRYMSPEQTLDPHEVDARTDVWSLGVSLYELWTGALPFEGTTHLRLCKAILEKDPTRPSELREGTPPALERLILRCLAKDRAARFPDVASLAEALAGVVAAAAPHAQAARVLLTAPPSTQRRAAAEPVPSSGANTVTSSPSLPELDTAAPAIVAAKGARSPGPGWRLGVAAGVVLVAGAASAAGALWRMGVPAADRAQRVASTAEPDRQELVQASTATRAQPAAPAETGEPPAPRRTPGARRSSPQADDDPLSHSH
jgi:serine/threonine-protein kinase